LSFQQARQVWERLKAELDAGRIQPDEFEARVMNLGRTDADGVEWRLSLTGGEWFRRVADGWERAEPVEQSMEPRQPLPVRIMPAFATLVTLTVVLGLAALLRGLPPLELAWISRARTTPVTITPAGAFPQGTLPGNAGTLTLEGGTSATAAAAEGDLTQTPPAATRTPAIARDGTITSTTEPGGSTSELPSGDLRVWRHVSTSNFGAETEVVDEWRSLLTYLDDIQFFVHQKRPSMRFEYPDFFIDIISENPGLYASLGDMELDEVFAIPGDNDQSAIDLLCHMKAFDNAYFLRVSRAGWRLEKAVGGVETTLQEGTLPADVLNGGWAAVRMRCAAGRIVTWLNGRQLFNVTDADLASGAWGVLFYLEGSADSGTLYWSRHAVRQPGEGTPGLFDAVEGRDLVVSLDAASFTSPGGLQVTLGIENWSQRSITLRSDQIWLQRADGTRFDVTGGGSVNPFDDPLVLSTGSVSGTLAFANVTNADAQQGLDLVLDLGAAGMGQVRFSIPPGL